MIKTCPSTAVTTGFTEMIMSNVCTQHTVCVCVCVCVSPE